MNSKYIGLSFIAILGLTACNDDYVDQFDIDETSLKEIVNKEYTLTDDDYSTLASLATAKKYAASLDTEEQSFSDALSVVGNNKYFSGIVSAEDFIPFLINQKWPEVDLGSKFIISYRQLSEADPVYTELTSATMCKYTLSDDDYKTVWADKANVSYLTPSTRSKISTILSSNVSAESGELAFVTYKYSENEPQTSTDENVNTWTKVTINNVPEGKSWNYVSSNVDLTEFAGKKVRIGFRYLSTSETAGTIELESAHVGEPTEGRSDLYMYKANEDGTYSLATKFVAGTYFIAGKNAEGNLVPFAKPKDASKTFGYFAAETPVTAAEKLPAESVAPYLVEVVAAENGLGYTLKNADGNYIYMTGTKNNFDIATEIPADGFGQWVFAWKGDGCVSIANTSNAKLVKYDAAYSNIGAYAGKYFAKHLCSESTEAPEGLSFVDVTLPDGASYIWSATKAYGLKATGYINKVSCESESWAITDEIDLSAATAPVLTFECAANNFSGADVNNFFEVYVSEDYKDGDAISVSGNKSLKAASADDVYGLYIYNGKSWKEYSSTDAKVVVVQQDLYSAIGSKFISNPDVILPTYLQNILPFASIGDRVAAIYFNESGNLKIEMYSFSDLGWTVLSTTNTETTTFTKDSDGVTAKISVFIDASLTDGNDGGFTTQDVNLTGGITYVWSLASSYGWKASAYANKVNNESESWLVSPIQNFKKATAPILSFEWAVNYAGSTPVTDLLRFYISTSYTGDVTTTQWVDITDKVQNAPTGSDWDYVSSDEIDLSEYIGGTFVFAVKYVSTSEVAATAEIKNVLLREKE